MEHKSFISPTPRYHVKPIKKGCLDFLDFWMGGGGWNGKTCRVLRSFPFSTTPIHPASNWIKWSDRANKHPLPSPSPSSHSSLFSCAHSLLKSIRLLVRVYASAKVSWMKGYTYMYSPLDLRRVMWGYAAIIASGNLATTVQYCTAYWMSCAFFTQAETSLIQTRNSTEWIFAQALVYVSRFFLWHISYTCKV